MDLKPVTFQLLLISTSESILFPIGRLTLFQWVAYPMKHKGYGNRLSNSTVNIDGQLPSVVTINLLDLQHWIA